MQPKIRDTQRSHDVIEWRAEKENSDNVTPPYRITLLTPAENVLHATHTCRDGIFHGGHSNYRLMSVGDDTLKMLIGFGEGGFAMLWRVEVRIVLARLAKVVACDESSSGLFAFWMTCLFLLGIFFRWWVIFFYLHVVSDGYEITLFLKDGWILSKVNIVEFE